MTDIGPAASSEARPLAAQGGRGIRSRRAARCAGCWLPSALCVCADLPRIDVATRVVVVMHRREAITSTNTGRLAARMLAGAGVLVRGRPTGPGAVAIEPEPLVGAPRLALYPAEGCRELTPGDAPAALLVPDGTWPQARRILRRDALFRGAEPVRLPEGADSRYGLRRRPREGTLCTLEAIARALAVLEGGDVERRMLEALDRFVERSLWTRQGRLAP